MSEHERMTQGGGTEKETETRREVSETTRTSETAPQEPVGNGDADDAEQDEGDR